MSVSASDLLLYHSNSSGTAGNSIPPGGMGGAIDYNKAVNQTTLTNNIFPQVTALEAGSSGLIDYRCIYIHNKNVTSTISDARFYMEVGPSSPLISITIGLGVAKGQAEATITDRYDSPEWVTFVSATTSANGLVLPSLGPDEYMPIWIKRVVTAGSAQSGVASFILTCVGETL